MAASESGANDSVSDVPPFALTEQQMEDLRLTLTGLAAAMAPLVRTATEWAESAAQRIAPALDTMARVIAEVGKTVLPALTYLAQLEQAKPPNWPSSLSYPRLGIPRPRGLPCGVGPRTRGADCPDGSQHEGGT